MKSGASKRVPSRRHAQEPASHHKRLQCELDRGLRAPSRIPLYERWSIERMKIGEDVAVVPSGVLI